MQYCNKSLIKNNNEILQYFNKNNDIALVMHQRALLDMSDMYIPVSDRVSGPPWVSKTM